MKISFVTSNTGSGCLGLVDTEGWQITTLSGDNTCYGWELDLDDIEEYVEIYAVDDTGLFIANNGNEGDPKMKIVDDNNNEVTVIKAGERYPKEGSHELKAQSSLKISLIEPEYVKVESNFKSSLLNSLSKENTQKIPGLDE